MDWQTAQQHSATPWHCSEIGNSDTAFIVDDNGQYILTIKASGTHAQPILATNLAFMCRAVNFHMELVRLIREASAILRSDGKARDPVQVATFCRQIDGTLKKATGERS